MPSGTRVRAANLLSRLAAEPEGYAECYPGLREMDDAIEDSDDEADYTKMDIGNKKGPIGKQNKKNVYCTLNSGCGHKHEFYLIF